MGQKVNPISFRIGVGRTWHSRWFASGADYKKFLFEDIMLRRALEERYKLAGVGSVDIERLPKAITIRLAVSRPGVVIGRGGVGIEDAKAFVASLLGFGRADPRLPKVEIVVEEVRNAEVSARLVAARIVVELERRLPHRRVISRVMDRVTAAGAKGIKVVLAGRIGGADIARTEKYRAGSVPTASLRADVDYAASQALLKRGYVGVKVWIHTGSDVGT